MATSPTDYESTDVSSPSRPSSPGPPGALSPNPVSRRTTGEEALAQDPSHDHHPPDQSHDPDPLPAYSDLKLQEGHRFGRWRGWIEKRAREHQQERNDQRREAELEGRRFGTGWELPEYQPNQSSSTSRDSLSASRHPTHLDRNPSIISTTDENAAFQTASQLHTANRSRQPSGGSASFPLQVDPGPGAVCLTPSTSIYNIGSRFLPQFPSQPLCAIPLPMNTSCRSRSRYSADRFLLIGTIHGLYVCDLFPFLSNTVNTDLISPSDSKIYQIWDGLGVHQLEIALEDFKHETSLDEPPSGSNLNITPGIVIALTSQASGPNANSGSEAAPKSVKMWPLQSLIYLVKFRVFSQSSECLDLRERPMSSKRTSALYGGASALAGLKSMFEKGKTKADSAFSEIYSSALHHSGANESRDSSFGPIPNTQGSLSRRQGSSSRGHQTPKHIFTSSSSQNHLELPLQWAKQNTSLDLPRIQANGPILFIKLSNSPTPGFNPISDELDQKSAEPIPAGLRARSRSGGGYREEFGSLALNRTSNGWWYLLIATKNFVFVMESQPSRQRTWHLCAEMSAPFTPRSANLVLSEFNKPTNYRASVHTSVSHSKLQSSGRRNEVPWAGAGEASVFLTMKEYSVSICLSDLSVRELDLPGTVTTSQTTATGLSRSRTKKLGTGSLSNIPNLEGVHTTLMQRNASANEAGLSAEPILVTKKVRDGGISMARDEAFRVENRRLNRSVNDRRWIGCEELLIPVTPEDITSTSGSKKRLKATARSVYLVTRGYLTYVVLSPLGVESKTKKPFRSSSSSSTDGPSVSLGGIAPAPILLKPIHTFTWRAIPAKVQASIIPKPVQWSTAEEVNGDGSGEDEIFCCLTAFTASGIEVQEGFISLSFARAMWKRLNKKDEPKLKGSFFTPASHYRPRKERINQEGLENSPSKPLQQQQQQTTTNQSPLPMPTKKSTMMTMVDKEDLNDNSSYDYNTKIGFLCESGSNFSTGIFTGNLNRKLNDNDDDYEEDYEEEEDDDDYEDENDGGEGKVDDDDDGGGGGEFRGDGLRRRRRSKRSRMRRRVEGISRRPKGSFFWKEAVGEWKIMYVCNSMGFN